MSMQMPEGLTEEQLYENELFMEKVKVWDTFYGNPSEDFEWEGKRIQVKRPPKVLRDDKYNPLPESLKEYNTWRKEVGLTGDRDYINDNDPKTDWRQAMEASFKKQNNGQGPNLSPPHSA